MLHTVYRGDGRTVSPSEMAARLGYSAMTMSRAFDELESIEIGEHSVKGKERYLYFQASGKDLWEQTQQFMRTPVKSIRHQRAYVYPSQEQTCPPEPFPAKR
ncbi:MAG: hypothetical protein JW913_16850 [Chitinispirillaceae bacterium]|nr:hypothetical protein [Chitinispirillaceae bacterium]